MGGVDVVLDDGSHVAGHQRVSFETLFPLLNAGGLYIIEDMHTSYWPGSYGGGYRRPGTAIELCKDVVDDMHGWYHDSKGKRVARQEVGAVHFYDSVAVIEKVEHGPPRHVKIGDG